MAKAWSSVTTAAQHMNLGAFAMSLTLCQIREVLGGVVFYLYGQGASWCTRHARWPLVNRFVRQLNRRHGCQAMVKMFIWQASLLQRERKFHCASQHLIVQFLPCRIHLLLPLPELVARGAVQQAYGFARLSCQDRLRLA